MFDGQTYEAGQSSLPERGTTTPIKRNLSPSHMIQKPPPSMAEVAARMTLAMTTPMAVFAGGKLAYNVSSNIDLPDVIPAVHRHMDSMPSESLPLVDERDKAELSVYAKYGRERMMEWLNLTKLSNADRARVEQKIGEMKKVIEENPSFEGMKNVLSNHAQSLIELSQKFGINPEIVLSVCLIENGGAEKMVSPAGAMWEMQVMPDLLSTKLDQRGMTREEFDALSDREKGDLLREIGVENLSDMYKLFGDWGLAVWAYHGGQGNVYRALKIYFEAEFDADSLPSGGFLELKNYYRKKIEAARESDKGFNFFILLNDERVKNEISDLEDETELYTLKVAAANQIINEQMPDLARQVLR